jgi:hypothetical protein
MLMSSCQEWWCGETNLGNRFALVSDKPIQIIYCTSDNTCCDMGWDAVPLGVTEYGFDEKWIVAKRSENDYWIIDKDFEIDLTGFDVPGRYEFYQSHIKGNLTKLNFDNIKDSLNIKIDLIKVN